MAIFGNKSKKSSNGKKRQSSQLRIAHGAYTKVLFKRIVKIMSLVFVLLFGLYIVFASTLLRVVPTTDAGFVPVKNLTYEGGNVPAGEQVLISMEKKQGNEFLDKLKQAFVPTTDAAIIKVVAGPYGALGWTEPDILSVNGSPVDVTLEPEDGDKSPLESRDDSFLKDEYLAICIKGDCEVGKGMIIPKDNVIGSPLSQSTVDKVVSGE